MNPNKKTHLLNFLIIGIFLFVVFLLINDTPKNSPSSTIESVNIGGQKVRVDLALTREEQAQGLSGRSDLKENDGMLFVFDNSGVHSFWMKDMNFPIDMIWITEDRKIFYIEKDARPDSYPTLYGPQAPGAKYILEVVSGFSDKNNLKVGDSIVFTY